MNCPNCSNKYSEEIYVPRILHNCGHTLCENCIKKIAKSEISKIDEKISDHVIICALCSKETRTKEITNLTKNLALIEIIFPKPYSHSQSNSLNLTSPRCEVLFLNNSATEFFPKKNKILCAEHFKDLEAYCNTCKKLLCVSCIIEKDHKNHDLVSFENAFLNECNSFNANFEKAKKDEENFDSIGDDLKNRKENLQKKYTTQIETVETFFKEVYTVLNEREKFIKVKLLNECENEENILKGFEEKLQILRALAENIKNIKNNFETLSEVEILSNSVETENIFKDINKNLEIVDKLQLIKEFEFSQLEREFEISILKEILSKRLITQEKEISVTLNEKEKIAAETLAAQNSKRFSNNNITNNNYNKGKRPSNAAPDTSVNKINTIPLYNPPEPVKFNYVKTDVDSRINTKKSESVLKLFPQLKSKTQKVSNLAQQASIKQLVSGNINSNISKKLSSQYQSNKGEINEIKEYNKPKESADDLSLEFDEKEFKEMNSDRKMLGEVYDDIKHVECIEDSMANTSHFIQTINRLNLNNEYRDKDAENQGENEIYSTQNTNMIQDSKIFYQLNDVTNNTRNEIDYNDFQVSSPGKVLNDLKSDGMNIIIGSNLDDMNNISSISHATKSFIQTDISSIYNKTGNPFVILLGGKGDYSTKKYSIEDGSWISANNIPASNQVVNTNKDIPTNTGTNMVDTTTHDFIKVERSDFVALMYKEKKILLIGGKTLNEKGVEVITDTIDLLNIKEKNVSRLSIKLKHCLINFGAVYINSKLYISGGFNGSQSTNNFEYFDKINRIWVDLPKMLFRRKEFSMVVGPDSCIYAIGGADEREVVTKSVEKFDLVKNCWTRIGDMNIKRKGCAGVCMPDGIYIIGGFDGCQYLKSVERYDFMSKKWSHIEDMNHPRCLFSCSVSSDLQYMYVAGGYDGKPLNTIERYDVFMNKWEVLERMVAPKYRHQSIFLKE